MSFRRGRSTSQQKSPKFRPIASKNNTTALQRFPLLLKVVGTVYKWGLRVGVKICLKCMTVLPFKENSVLSVYFLCFGINERPIIWISTFRCWPQSPNREAKLIMMSG